MRVGLRWKILLVTVITPLALGVAALVKVHRNVSEHVDSSSIHESLEHTVRVFEGMMAVRGRALAGGAEVIARDPRFFSLLAVGTGQRDHRFDMTVREMARDLNGITKAEMFEVFDRRGKRLASAGSVQSTSSWRDAIAREALAGRPSLSAVVQGGSHFQVSASPVRSDGRVVGVLLLGSEIGGRLANQVRAQMRSEVTFIADTVITCSTLEIVSDRRALMTYIREAYRRGGNRGAEGVTQVTSGGLTFITVIRHLPGSAFGGRQLYVMQRARDPETEFLQKMQRSLTALAVVGVLAALLTGLVFSEYITAPIQQLVRGAQEMQQGNYNHPMDVRSKDEIGFLADRFLEMRQREQVYVNSLEEASRLKSEFITVASHELRTPISAIQGYGELIASGAFGAVPPAQHQALDGIKSCIQELTRIAERATLVAQVQGERLTLNRVVQPIDLVLRHAVGSAQAASPGRDVEVDIQVAPGVEPIAIDGDLLAQAITHLVTNGVRFTADGGTVEVRAVERDGHLEIRVADQGPGIPLERLAHLFEHGYAIGGSLQHHSSAENEFNSRGLGLGLGITRGVVEAHGGTVSADNRPEGGTVFLVRIPRREAPEAKAA